MALERVDRLRGFLVLAPKHASNEALVVAQRGSPHFACGRIGPSASAGDRYVAARAAGGYRTLIHTLLA
jgi:hypothetical protein